MYVYRYECTINKNEIAHNLSCQNRCHMVKCQQKKNEEWKLKSKLN